MRSSGLGRVPTILLVLVVPLVALVTVVVTLNVTSDDTGDAAASGRRRGEPAIDIANFQYSPDPFEVSAGTAVTVTNRDDTKHTLTANEGAFDTGELDGGTSATVTITKPGTYRYFCEIHNYMTGTIEVR